MRGPLLGGAPGAGGRPDAPGGPLGRIGAEAGNRSGRAGGGGGGGAAANDESADLDFHELVFSSQMILIIYKSQIILNTVLILKVQNKCSIIHEK